tara:strand:+ start:448 stop:732 length:285 start_codon:yes stop_codon:yes gene_type:complete
VLFKKILAEAYLEIKFPFSILKTKLLILKSRSYKEKEEKSASDNGTYPELALKAALDPATFSVLEATANILISLSMFQENKVKNTSESLERNTN